MSMAANCVFCKIIAGEIPSTFVHRGEDVVAIEDSNPQAPAHVLVMPVKHVANLSEFTDTEGAQAVAELFGIASRLGRKQGTKGFRIVINSGAQGGQTVDHLHVHVLSGRQMQWPPG
jgi:histidine triad (HIT) family protein